MKNPRITVMIPVYNMKNEITRSINSVLEQDYGNKELIVLDGGSTDGTAEMIREYENRIDFFISEKDEGPSAAMAKNISHVTGHYVTVLGADDYYEQGALSACARTITATDADVAFGDCNFYYPDGRVLRKCANSRGLENLYYYNALFSNAAFVKKELLQNYYENEWQDIRKDISISTDHYLWLLLYHRGNKFTYIDSENALTNYSVSGRSSTNEFEGCMDDDAIIHMVLWGDKVAEKKNLTEFDKYFAARSVGLYETVIGLENYRDEILKHLNQKENYVIFGTGDMSRKVLRMMEVIDVKPLYFVDNNVGRNAAEYHSYKVYHPDKLENENNLSVIISALGNEEAIRQQLKDMELVSSVKLIDYSDLAQKIQNHIGREVLEDAWRKGIIK